MWGRGAALAPLFFGRARTDIPPKQDIDLGARYGEDRLYRHNPTLRFRLSHCVTPDETAQACAVLADRL
jgi:hypothetical protein